MTKTFKINGMKYDGKKFKNEKLVLRFTEDKLGKTLSLSDDRGTMLLVPVDGILQLMKDRNNENSP